MTEATIDLRRYGDAQPRMDSRVRTGMLTMLGAGAGIAAIAALVSVGGFDMRVLAVRLIADAIVLLTLVAYISLSTRAAVAQLRQQIVGDIVAQVSAVVANRVANTLEGEYVRAADNGRQGQLAELVERQNALTKEVARQRGQISIGLRDLTEAVERVECCVKADVAVAYDLGKRSARD